MGLAWLTVTCCPLNCYHSSSRVFLWPEDRKHPAHLHPHNTSETLQPDFTLIWDVCDSWWGFCSTARNKNAYSMLGNKVNVLTTTLTILLLCQQALCGLLTSGYDSHVHIEISQNINPDKFWSEFLFDRNTQAPNCPNCLGVNTRDTLSLRSLFTCWPSSMPFVLCPGELAQMGACSLSMREVAGLDARILQERYF